MKTIRFFRCLLLSFFTIVSVLFAQETDSTITDYDGNLYHTVVIGEQVWLKENIKSLHYSDGTEIPGAVAYNNSDINAEIYGRLYTWDASMKDSKTEGAQGVCPCGWHVPSDAEWKQLENFLGGAAAAGGKMKEAGTAHWKFPNTGATNSSGFTGLPAGEFDAYFNPNKFWLLHTAAVFWTSTQSGQSRAIERYLSHDDAASGKLPWYKVMKYSIRCVKDTGATKLSYQNGILPTGIHLKQNYPNPFNPNTIIEYFLPQTMNIQFSIYNIIGQKLAVLYEGRQNSGSHYIDFRGQNLPSGIYIYELKSQDFKLRKRCLLLK
ncbi:MAG: T9SS type A sorting domain-containing protein [Calditrichales bacterium]|nr:T9SS type A sorting domain-containing protein [Calditrichales bacterium]